MGEHRPPVVAAWWKGQTEDQATNARNTLRDEAVNILKTVGIELSGYPEEAGPNFNVAQLMSAKAYEGMLKSTPPADKFSISFGYDENDARGLLISVVGAGIKLDVKEVDKLGSVLEASKARGKAPRFTTTEDRKFFKLGEFFAGSGFVTDPNLDLNASKTGPARMFLTPLCGFVIEVHFHPEKETVTLAGQRRFPVILGYRVDGIFGTTHSAVWQTLKSWTLKMEKAEKGKAAKIKHVFQGLSGIPPSPAMELYPVVDNGTLLSLFLKCVRASDGCAWQRHPYVLQVGTPAWVEACFDQAAASAGDVLFKAMEKQIGPSQIDNLLCHSVMQSPPNSVGLAAYTENFGSIIGTRNTDLSFRDDQGFPCSSGLFPLDKSDWVQKYEEETLDLAKFPSLNWNNLRDGLETDGSSKRTKKNVTVYLEVEEDEEGEADNVPAMPKGPGFYDPNHKARNDKALGAIFQRKFLHKDVVELDANELEKAITHILENWPDHCASTCKRHLRAIFKDVTYDKILNEDKMPTLKARLVEHFGGTFDEEEPVVEQTVVGEAVAVQPSVQEVDGLPPTIQARRPERRNRNSRDDEEEQRIKLDAMKTLAMEAVENAVNSWEWKIADKFTADIGARVKHTLESNQKHVKLQIMTAIEKKISDIPVPAAANVLVPADPGPGLSSEELQKLAENSAQEAAKEVMKKQAKLAHEKARVSSLRSTMLHLVAGEDGLRYVVAMMKRKGPSGEVLFTDEEIAEDAEACWLLAPNQISAILKEAGVQVKKK